MITDLIEKVSAAAYAIPTDAPEGDGTLTWSKTTLVLAEVRAGGMVGRGWTYGTAACAEIINSDLAPLVEGQPCADVPRAQNAMIIGSRNNTRPGAVGYAISAVDIALWDLKARLLELPLHQLFGRCRDQMDVYGSGGFTTYPAGRLESQLDHWVSDLGIPRVKIKIGESWGAAEERDIDRIRQARAVIGEGTELFVDANGGYRAKQAVRVLERAADARITWLEEPVSSDDLEGLRLVRSQVTADVTAGEYGSDETYFRRMCAAGAVDCLQVDATRCGGLTAWFRAAAVAASFGLDVSAHCAPHVHVAAALATVNARHLEWFHDHVRIESRYFDGALDPSAGSVTPDDTAPGHGMVPRTADLEPMRVR